MKFAANEIVIAFIAPNDIINNNIIFKYLF